MEKEAQPTCTPGMLCGEQTLPAVAFGGTEPEAGYPRMEGAQVEQWQVVSRMLCGASSALYLAQSEERVDAVVKLYRKEVPVNRGVWRRLMMLQDPCLVPLLSCGSYEEHPYEVVPFYPEGTLEGQKLSEQTLIQVIIPQLDQAISALHRAHLLHNDVKPANLFWKQRGKQIVLGDYDCVGSDTAQQVTGGTPAYMAPETLFSHGKVRTAASDYCSMGLTLLALVTGSSVLADQSEKAMIRTWQRGLQCPETVSPRLGTLIQGLLRYDPQKRLGHEDVQRWLKQDGNSGTVTIHHRKETGREQTGFRPLHFKERILLDLRELPEAAQQDWAYATFLLRQHQLNDFLIQFDPRYYDLCERCAQMFDADEGLFRLLQTICPSTALCWCGQVFENLEQFAEQAAARSPLANGDPAVRFLRMGLLEFYLEKNGGNERQRDFAVNLKKLAMEDADLAVSQLLVSMSAHPEFNWHGKTFYTLQDVTSWLMSCREDLDGAVEELYRARRFEAWLDFIHCGRFIPEIRNTMRGVEL